MKTRAGLLILAVFVLAVVLNASGLFATNRSSGHDFAGRCESCHLSRPTDGRAGRFARQISFLCQSCHNMNEQNSHPIGMAPSMPMPDGFSLDWSGRMTCATCHDPHSQKNNRYLRTAARGRQFCELCHQGFMPMEGKHVGVSGLVHAKRGIYNDRSSLRQVLDDISMECLNCHDGVIASDASYKIAGGDALTYQRSGLSHPVGMDYRKAALQDRELRPVELLSPLITLYEGKVGCGSCHNPYSREKRMLVVSNRGSALCRECHIK